MTSGGSSTEALLPNHCIVEGGISSPSSETPHTYKVHSFRGARLLSTFLAIKFLGFESPRVEWMTMRGSRDDVADNLRVFYFPLLTVVYESNNEVCE